VITMTEVATGTGFPVRVPAVSEDQTLKIAATVYPPPRIRADDPATVLVCWPGGSYDRGYWDINYAGRTDYSAAKYWAQRGFIVVAADQLGVGESSKPVVAGDAVSLEMMGAAADSFVELVRTRLRDGSLHPDIPALERVTMVGVGHSLGGFTVVAQQAEHASYERICCLGVTHSAKVVVDESMGREAVDPTAVAEQQAKLFFKETWDDLYGLPSKAEHSGWLYGADDDPEVTAADSSVSARWARRPYVQALLDGYSAPLAARVTSPVFLGFSEIDVAAEPRTEPVYYPGSNDITLHLLPRAGHCSNFAPTRFELWDRIAAWAR
jgi:pimeloyl-ACP methyl ester carboxylesterase